jgi:hypothetical protein
MNVRSKLAIAAGAFVLLAAGAAAAKTLSDCCCKNDCCDEMTAPQTPAPAPQAQ